MAESVERTGHPFAALAHGVATGTIDRRTFMARATALGLSASVAATVFRTYNASAGPAPRRAAGGRHQEDPGITVTVDGTPQAVGMEDLSGATPGGTLRFARAEDSTTFDPVTTPYNVDIWVFMSVYEQLLRVAPNGVELEPALAERWEISEDGLTYTFHLRPGVLFSDGTPMKASDVVYSLNRAKNDPTQTWTFSLAAMKEATAPDDATVVITLTQPWAPFLSDIAMFNASVMPEAWASGNEARLAEEMLGTGPFMLGEWKRDESILLTKNPNYWEEGLPLLDEVRIAKVPDDNSRILQLQGGEIDAMHNVPLSRVAELEGDENLKVIKFPSTHSQYLVLNQQVEPLDDVNVRLALNHATDKQALIDIVLFGNGVEATTFMPRGALYWNDQLEGFPYDLEKAKASLAQSKAPEGFPIELMHLAGDVENEQLAAAIKDMWSQIGVEVLIAPTEQSVFYDAFGNQTFQIQSTYWTNDIIDPDELVSFAVLPESANAFRTGWANAEAVELGRTAPGEADPEKRKQMYFRIQELFNQDAPMVLLYHKPFINAMTTKVRNFQQPPTGQWVWKATWIER